MLELTGVAKQVQSMIGFSAVGENILKYTARETAQANVIPFLRQDIALPDKQITKSSTPVCSNKSMLGICDGALALLTIVTGH